MFTRLINIENANIFPEWGSALLWTVSRSFTVHLRPPAELY